MLFIHCGKQRVSDDMDPTSTAIKTAPYIYSSCATSQPLADVPSRYPEVKLLHSCSSHGKVSSCPRWCSILQLCAHDMPGNYSFCDIPWISPSIKTFILIFFKASAHAMCSMCLMCSAASGSLIQKCIGGISEQPTSQTPFEKYTGSN